MQRHWNNRTRVHPPSLLLPPPGLVARQVIFLAALFLRASAAQSHEQALPPTVGNCAPTQTQSGALGNPHSRESPWEIRGRTPRAVRKYRNGPGELLQTKRGNDCTPATNRRASVSSSSHSRQPAGKDTPTTGPTDFLANARIKRKNRHRANPDDLCLLYVFT